MIGGKPGRFKNVAQAKEIAHRCRPAGKELKRTSGVSSEPILNIVANVDKHTMAAGAMGKHLEDKSWEREA